jgi:hypothetical protein
MPGLGESYNIQDILDSADTEDEMLLFKDSNGAVWEIVREDQAGNVYTEEDENIDLDPLVNLKL